MRFTVIAVAVACFAGPTVAEARGLEYGPRVTYSVPTGKAGDALDPCVGYGLTGTFMGSSPTGFGVDIVYHRWPGSPEVDRSIDELLSIVSRAPISGSRSSASALQATLHVKAVPLERGPIRLWMKLGMGVHRFDPKLELPIAALQDAGVRVGTSGSDDVSYGFGHQLGLGLDFMTVADTRLGLDVSFQWIDLEDVDHTAVSFGLSLLSVPR